MSSMQWDDFRSCVSGLSVKDQKLIRVAFELGKNSHGDQKRRSGEPYFTHPIAVAEIIAGLGGDKDTIIGALLHDTIEDTNLTLDEIEKLFGNSVKTLIDGMTKLSENDEKLMPHHDEQIETLRKIFTLMQEDIRIMVIKLADRLHNMKTAIFLPSPRRTLLAQETVDVYVKIADRLCMREFRDSLEEVCIQILEPEISEELLSLRRKNETNGKKILENTSNSLFKSYPLLAKKLSMRYENKSWGRLRVQMEEEESNITEINSLNIVLIADNIPTCYEILGFLHQIWKRETMSFEDFINAPMINGYQGLHTTLILENGTRMRCKIRTTEMDKYARMGITTKCFDSTSTGIVKYLQWTKHITELSEDTSSRSEQFWSSLQSDILGESIVVHGPNDKTLALPKDSTALDGAIYLFGKEALKVTDIQVNGQYVPFATPLQHASSINIKFGNKNTVIRDWLNWVQTGYAVAMIRSALSQKSNQYKIRTGYQLLHNTLKEHRAGLIEEFDEENIRDGLLSLGLKSLKETYIAIADGHADPEEIYSVIFSSKKKNKKDIPAKKSFLIGYCTPLNTPEIHSHLSRIHEQFQILSKNVFYNPKNKGNFSYSKIKARFDPESLRLYTSRLQAAGVKDINIVQLKPRIVYTASMVLLIILWGLDPVFAKFILLRGVSAYELTIIRFATFFFAATIIYLLQGFLSTQKLKPLSPFSPLLIGSSVTMFITALMSYLALSHISPVEYILFIIGCISTISFIENVIKRNAQLLYLAITVIAIFSGISLLIYIDKPNVQGLLFALIGAIGFALYSKISSKYQKGIVDTRYPAYLFWISAIALPISLLLISQTHFFSLSYINIVMSILFVLMFSVLPYGLYFECMRGIHSDTLDHALPFVIVSTIIGEEILTKSPVSLLMLFLLPLFVLQYRRTQRKVV